MRSVLGIGIALLVILGIMNAFVPDSVEAAQRATSTPGSRNKTYYVTAAANGRECPKLTCDVIEKYVGGEAVEVIDDTKGDTVRGSDLWYEVRVSRRVTVFIHSSLLTDKKPVPRATSRGGNSSSAATPVPGATSVPTEVAPTWSCVGDIYNCDDFANWNEANAYFQACPGDPSKLDRNKDGSPCDSMR